MGGSSADFEAGLRERGYGCFDLFGLDVMFNEQLHPFILEVNAGPNLETEDRGEESTGLLQDVKTPLIQQLARWISLRLSSHDQRDAREIEEDALQNFTRVL